MTHVLFVPWKNIQMKDALNAAQIRNVPYPLAFKMPGVEYVDKNATWMRQARDSTKKARNFVEIFFDGTKHDTLKQMRDGQIYIRGHGLPGQHTIMSGTDLSKQRPNLEKVLQSHLGPGDLATRLIDSGLEPAFAGKIKCYNCHSADGTQDESPFAQMFADVMAMRGYTNCTYWGYRGALSSVYMSFKDDPHMHKDSTFLPGTRASEARMQIFPRT